MSVIFVKKQEGAVLKHIAQRGALLLTLCLASATVDAQTQPGAAFPGVPSNGIGYSPGKADDEISWKSFLYVVKEVVSPSYPIGTLTYQTWATDADTFVTGKWPEGQDKQHGFQKSALTQFRLHGNFDPVGVPTACGPPGNPTIGSFPTPPLPSVPENCLAEEVRRNRPAFDYIVDNQLNNPTKLAAFGKIAFPQHTDRTKAALELKVDWIPVDTLVTWLRGLGVIAATKTQQEAVNIVRDNYFITKPATGPAYAMLSMHISLKDRPNWLWATFEHQWNPGRCDTMGCYDQFGMPPALAAIPPNPTVINGQYASCETKSEALGKLIDQPAIPPNQPGILPIWNKYCLKATQTQFTVAIPTTVSNSKSPTPTSEPGPAINVPVLNGDSVVERILAGVPIAQSSCITCHAYAAFNKKTGCISPTNAGLGSPAPIGLPAIPSDQQQFDFVWGLIAGPSNPGSCK